MKKADLLNVNINGNRKLRNTDSVRFLIWNLPAVRTCPFRTLMCEKSCYARKAERLYPQVLPARETNYQMSLRDDFAEHMIDTIEYHLASKAFAGKKVIFRIHESGDFYNREYAQKWIDIARYFENDMRITFLAYTKSLKYMIECGYGKAKFPKNLIIRASLWDDTKQCERDIIAAYDMPIYTALTKREFVAMGDKYARCDCADCANCGKCWDANNKRIACEIH